jgi:hypothetical protein
MPNSSEGDADVSTPRNPSSSVYRTTPGNVLIF